MPLDQTIENPDTGEIESIYDYGDYDNEVERAWALGYLADQRKKPGDPEPVTGAEPLDAYGLDSLDVLRNLNLTGPQPPAAPGPAPTPPAPESPDVYGLDSLDVLRNLNLMGPQPSAGSAAATAAPPGPAAPDVYGLDSLDALRNLSLMGPAPVEAAGPAAPRLAGTATVNQGAAPAPASGRRADPIPTSMHYLPGFVDETSRLGEGILGAEDWAVGEARDKTALGSEMLKQPGQALDWLTGPRPKGGRGTTVVAKPRAPIAKTGTPTDTRTGELDLVEAAYNRDPEGYFEHLSRDPSMPDEVRAQARESLETLDPARGAEARREDLGFSWGKNVILDAHGRPTTDKTLRDSISGKVIEAHESRPFMRGEHPSGGGWVIPNADSLPWNQLPESNKDALLEEIKVEQARADLGIKKAQAQDPFGARKAGAVAEAQEGAKRKSEDQRRAGFKQRLDVENAWYANAMRKIEALKQRGLPDPDYKKQLMEIQARHTGQLEAIKAEYKVAAQIDLEGG